MNKEKELDMNELIESFGECSTDYSKTACTYYANYLEEYQKEKIKLQQENKELHNKIDKAIEILENWNCPECDKNTMREISFSSNKENVLEILKDSDAE